MRTLTPRRVVGLDELLDGASLREPMEKDFESKSGSAFERVVIDGESYVLKHLHADDDWIMRATGDIVCRPLVMWRTGLYDALPECFEHTVAGVAGGLGRNGWGAAVLMRDVAPWLVSVPKGVLNLEQHLRFLDHMAELHASFWGFRDEIGLMPMGSRYNLLSHWTVSAEAERGPLEDVLGMITPGWKRVALQAPAAMAVAGPLLDDPSPLAGALSATPLTLVHSDWKAGNLGTLPDGRTVLIDWAFPGEAPGCCDLAWYIAVNCDLLPQTKDDSIDAYRAALERRGIDTAPWWDAQLELSLIGAFALLGWSKSGDELAWWDDRLPRSARFLR